MQATDKISLDTSNKKGEERGDDNMEKSEAPAGYDFNFNVVIQVQSTGNFFHPVHIHL